MGNRTAWRMWGLLLPTYFVAFLHRTALSTLAEPLAQGLGLHENVGASLGALAGAYFFVYAALQIPSGLVADTVGPRLTVSISSALMGVATILFAHASSWSTAVAARCLIGIGAAFNFIALLRQQVNWFHPRYFPLLTALTVVTGNLGALVGIGPFGKLALACGWRQAFTVVGTITLVFSAMVAVLVHDAPGQRTRPNWRELMTGLRAVAANPTNYLTFLAFGLSSGVYMTFGGFWAIPFLKHVHGLETSRASACATMMMLGVVAGCPLTSLLVRLFGSARRSGVAMLTAAIPLWLIVVFSPLPTTQTVLLYGLFFVLGVCVSGFILPYTTVRESNPEQVIGTALAFTNTGGFISIALLQVAVGAILDLFVSAPGGGAVPSYPAVAYWWALGMLVALHVVAVGAYWLVPEKSTVHERTGESTQ